MLSPPPLQPPRPQTVLIVEDDPDLRRIFAGVLFWAGFRVEQTDDGMTALRIIEADPPDLLLLDIVLPTLDGLSVRDELAAHAGRPQTNRRNTRRTSAMSTQKIRRARAR